VYTHNTVSIRTATCVRSASYEWNEIVSYELVISQILRRPFQITNAAAIAQTDRSVSEEDSEWQWWVANGRHSRLFRNEKNVFCVLCWLSGVYYVVPVCPHAGGVGLCEMIQHLSIFDYIRLAATLDDRSYTNVPSRRRNCEA